MGMTSTADRKFRSPAASLRVAAPLVRSSRMSEAQPTVEVVDDDPQVRESLTSLLRSMGLEGKALVSVADFLKSERPEGPTCLVLDARLPGRSGLDLQRQLLAAKIHIPDHLHHWLRRHSAVGSGDEGKGDRIPDKAMPRPGSTSPLAAQLHRRIRSTTPKTLRPSRVRSRSRLRRRYHSRSMQFPAVIALTSLEYLRLAIAERLTGTTRSIGLAMTGAWSRMTRMARWAWPRRTPR